jgi:hypothetical protein
MLDMADKKKTGRGGDKKSDAHGPIQVPFRVEDPRLVEALDRYADSIRRSRNMTIVLLLEQALEQAGHWPPAGAN